MTLANPVFRSIAPQTPIRPKLIYFAVLYNDLITPLIRPTLYVLFSGNCATFEPPWPKTTSSSFRVSGTPVPISLQLFETPMCFLILGRVALSVGYRDAHHASFWVDEVMHMHYSKVRRRF